MLLNPYRFAPGTPPPVVEGYPVVLDTFSGSLNTASTTAVIQLPATVNAGDLLYIVSARRSDNTTAPTAPAGWSVSLNNADTTPTPDQRAGQIYKVADGTEGGTTVTITWPTAVASTYAGVRIKAGTFDSWVLPLTSTSHYDGPNVTPFSVPLRCKISAIRRVQAIAIAGLNTVSSWANAEDQQVASGTGVAASSSRLHMASEVQTSGVGTTPDYKPWVTSGTDRCSTTSAAIRGSQPVTGPDFQYFASLNINAASSGSFTIPTRLNVGDLVYIVAKSSSGSMSTPSGWTLVYAATGGDRVFSRVLTAGDIGSTVNVTCTVSARHGAMVVAVRAGTYRTDALPTILSATGTSTTPTISATTLSADYAGRSNVVLGMSLNSTTNSYIPTAYPYPYMKTYAAAGSVSSFAVVGCSIAAFDGVDMPGGTFTFSGSNAWTTLAIAIPGMPI